MSRFYVIRPQRSEPGQLDDGIADTFGGVSHKIDTKVQLRLSRPSGIVLWSRVSLVSNANERSSSDNNQ